jgi:hypothetical protein
LSRLMGWADEGASPSDLARAGRIATRENASRDAPCLPSTNRTCTDRGATSWRARADRLGVSHFKPRVLRLHRHPGFPHARARRALGMTVKFHCSRSRPGSFAWIFPAWPLSRSKTTGLSGT